MARKFSLGVFVFACAVLSGFAGAADGVDVSIQMVREDPGLFLMAKGEFALDGQNYTFQIWVEDVQQTGRASASKHENWYFTADSYEGYTDYQVVPKLLGLNGKLYEVRLDYEAKRFQLKPYAGEMAPVDIGLETERLSLKGSDASPNVMLYRPGKRVLLPPGKYTLDQYQLVKKAEGGARWYVCALGTDKSPVLSVQKGTNAALSIGGPYAPGVKASVVKVGPGLFGSLLGRPEKEVAALNFALIGTWNEDASQVFPIGAASRPPAPTYRLRKSDGEIVAQGRFEYG
ncbi:MAG: hypothetical protein IT364_17525 [Candidatus Hydrogenedentes bacterium]|nr:hypothetical protein [Candidatus Hydrogenedentota bacterium]